MALKELGKPAIALLPNPANDRVQVVFNGTVRSNWKVELFNPTGMLLKTMEVTNASGALLNNLDQFQKGLYSIRCTDLLNKQTFTEKLLLQ